MKFTPLVLDAGNAQIKAYTGDNWTFYPHALWKLTPSQVASLDEHTDGGDRDIARVNDVWYAVGEKAMTMGFNDPLLGEGRYIPEYYGVIAAITANRVFDSSIRNLYIYGSHTPKDALFREDLVQSVLGSWVVESEGKQKVFNVKQAKGFEEPTGAFRHATLSDDGLSIRGPVNLMKRSVILDIGGYTFALSRATKGKVDYTQGVSETVGILKVLKEFENQIKRRYKKMLMGTNRLDPLYLREALQTGVYNAGGLGDLPVQAERDAALNILLTPILQGYKNYGGSASFDAVLLCGGGSVLLEKVLREKLNHQHIFPADENRKEMHLSTVRGGLKVLRALDAKGMLD